VTENRIRLTNHIPHGDGDEAQRKIQTCSLSIRRDDQKGVLLKRLSAMSERLRGSLPDFMTREDLRKMREDRKWDMLPLGLTSS
jgi:hypothetical protein